MKNHSNKRLAVLAAAVAGLGLYGISAAVAPVSAADTGFNQTDGGPYDYNTPANWVGGVINGTWDSSLTLTATQTVTFGADTALGTGLSFLYDGSQQLTLRSDGTADRTLTLGGDILVNTVSTNRTITLGSGTANQKLNIDLGGATRTFDIRGTANSAQRTLTFANAITHGSLILEGGGNVNFAPSAVTTYSLSSLSLKNIILNATNNKTSVNVAGALTFDGIGGLNGSGNTGGIGILSLGNGATVSAGSLARANNGVALFRGTSLGGGSTSIKFATAPTLVGGSGGAGSTNIKIIPWALGGTSTTTFDTFVTYDATNGIRPLDPNTEFDNYAGGYSGPVTGTDHNVKVADGGTVEFTGINTTVNSLSVNYNGSAGGSTTINGDPITVTSGAVSLVSRQGATLNADLKFGSAQGVIGYTQGKGSTIAGAISGSGGLVLYQQQPHTTGSSSGTGVEMTGNAANSTYTGDTYILSRVNNAIDGFLPSGSRSGDVYVYGMLSTTGFTINGLNGTGLLSKAFSGTGTVTVGDNDANGNFSGVIDGQLNLIKIGGGTQVLGGTSSYSGATTVSAGTLLVNGSIASSSGVSVADGATLGGSGDAGNITVADGGHLAPGNSPGTLHAASLVLNDASNLDYELGSLAGPNDLIDITGDLTLDGILNLTNLGGLEDGRYTLMTYTGNLSDNGLALGSAPGAFNYSIDTGTTGSVFLNVSSVPEPGTLTLLGLGGLLALRRRRLA